MGNIFPDAYRVYIGSDNMPHIFRGLEAQFEENYEAAFSYVKQEIIRLIDAGAEENIRLYEIQSWISALSLNYCLYIIRKNTFLYVLCPQREIIVMCLGLVGKHPIQ